MATYRNSDEALMERVRRYIKGLWYYNIKVTRT